jgi:hypothetical protein
LEENCSADQKSYRVVTPRGGGGGGEEEEEEEGGGGGGGEEEEEEEEEEVYNFNCYFSDVHIPEQG